ncbi:hypothetical protein NDU88_005505 [Pleurodeles waltl]|uniref:Uncharacterized protein n=1 Tax=Pleurodeles waltl TaxID=8319 RepID=A0AAV7MB63_PLEWA|nr:hypothetical protein NDU88_005505 [Pleurodeles waltl]
MWEDPGVPQRTESARCWIPACGLWRVRGWRRRAGCTVGPAVMRARDSVASGSVPEVAALGPGAFEEKVCTGAQRYTGCWTWRWMCLPDEPIRMGPEKMEGMEVRLIPWRGARGAGGNLMGSGL